MNQTRNISVKSSVLEALMPHLSSRPERNRFHTSYAVWQLARMGAYNEASDLPQAVRLEATGDCTELYTERDRLVCPVDIAETDVIGSDILTDALVRCAVFLSRSRRDDMVDLLIVTSSKSAETAPAKLSDWDNVQICSDKLTARLEELKNAGMLRKETDVNALVSGTLQRIGVEYCRKRHGRLGDEALWGRELEAVKVLEDAGIDGADLASALSNLVAHASGNQAPKKSSGLVFRRNDAMLMIRDYQRRARIQRPGVRVIDLIEMEKSQESSCLTPRNPGWKDVTSSSAVSRPVFESAVRWARLAAVKSGRGLLPIFYFTGEEGSGRSYLLKQVAWQLYLEGFPVAEIINLEEAAREAESLAAAAVALDAPLVLIWDDAHDPGFDVVHAYREFSEAQVSGVPIMILAAASDLGYNPKKIRQISRTSFEEFEVHGLEPAELNTVFVSQSEENQANPEVDQATGTSDQNTETPEDSIRKLQEQKTDEFTILVSQPDDTAGISMLRAVIQKKAQMSIETYAGELRRRILDAAGEGKPVFDLIHSLGMVGFSIMEKLAVSVCGDQAVKAFKTSVDQKALQDVVCASDAEGTIWDCGHPTVVRAMVELDDVSCSGITDNLSKAMSAMIREPGLQNLTGKLMRAILHSSVLPKPALTVLTDHLISLINNPDLIVSPVVLSDIFTLAFSTDNEPFQTTVVDALAAYSRLNAVDSYVALTSLLRNRLGGIDDSESLDILKSAKPDIDRIAFKFLLKFLGDHQPNEFREASIENARTAAARAPDKGFAVAAYLKFCWLRGTDDQISRSIEETTSWLAATPDDRIVRRAFIEYVISKGSDELKRESIEPLEDWLENHVDEGPLRNSLIELAFSVNDPAIGDRILESTARWIEKRGNNRLVRQNYFRRAEKRNDRAIMQRACDVAVAWLNNHADDRDTVRSLLFIACRLGEDGSSPQILSAIHNWLTNHVIERDVLRRYLMLVDRGGRGRAMTHAVEIGLKWIQENPEDLEIREILLGMTARKVDRKMQIRVYDVNVQWLEALDKPNPSVEYMIGRLGVRAGIARRAIPLLERTVAHSSGELSNHARLWLGSAYRVAEAYGEARKVWLAVRDEGDPEMVSRANRNLESLETHLKEKFPQGYPPLDEKLQRRRPPEKSAEDRRPVAGDSRPRRNRVGDQDQRPRPSDQPRPRPFHDKDSRLPKRPGDSQRKPQQKTDIPAKTGATLGDLFRMKGLDLSSLTSSTDNNDSSSDQ